MQTPTSFSPSYVAPPTSCNTAHFFNDLRNVLGQTDPQLVAQIFRTLKQVVTKQIARPIKLLCPNCVLLAWLPLGGSTNIRTELAVAGDQGLKYSGRKKNIPLGTLPKSPHVSREAGMLMEVKRLADAQEMAGSSLRASFDDPYFRIADPPLGAGYSR